MSTHVRLSPSKLEALEQCPRFAYPIQESDYATEGIKLHKACELRSYEGLDPDQAALVRGALLFTDNLRLDCGPEGAEVLTEHQVTLESRPGEPECDLGDNIAIKIPGIVDYLLLPRDPSYPLIIIDFKFGRGIVTDAQMNFQQQCYAAAALQAFPKYTSAKAYVYQPRVPRSDDEGPIPPGVFDRNLIRTALTRVYRVQEEVQNPFTPPRCVPDLCNKCRWAQQCPAVNALVKATGEQILGLPLPAEFAPERLVDPRDRAIAQLLGTVFERWTEQVKENNLAFALGGGEIPGYKVVNSSSGKRLPQDRTAEAITLLAKLCTTDEILSASTVSISALAEVLSKTRGEVAEVWKGRLQTELTPLLVESPRRYLRSTQKKNETPGAFLSRLLRPPLQLGKEAV